MKAITCLAMLLISAVAFTSSLQANANASEKTQLLSASDFADIADKTARAQAMFEEIGKVIQHPRCLNCHPADNHPLQGMDMKIHEPLVFRGLGNFGVPGMECNTCHGANNVEIIAQADDIKSIPGNPKWHLAPLEMAWVGKSLGEICQQLKDKERNGGKTMAEMIHHMAEDDLVGWGWYPGKGREPVPGTQKAFGKLFKAWVDNGAHCPTA
ncbi:Isoquinoline 1-oxidoreductase subunit [Alteromonas pelagimontana]|uniref:Isoquinoline 1-oxidoreductase subunit n=1 Tax=Alteromonas pelagimontana TaxID=1858656 RepID=A0A6M4M814_9ALTE|nr:Isoquinoline 1-oxidoreductase subunit [Alteromonas pelagimontana]QJR79371.1 Isoquinoline 1-oxidoreductase subunit [Alteromonas pelagimontana]